MPRRRGQHSKGELGDLADRLAASERRNEELAKDVRDLTGELARVKEAAQDLGARSDAARQVADEAHTATATQADQLRALGDNIEAMATKTREDQRRHAAAIDVLRRHQKGLDERLTTEDSERRSDVERIHRVVGDQAARVNDNNVRVGELAESLAAGLARADEGVDRLQRDQIDGLARVRAESEDRLRRLDTDVAAARTESTQRLHEMALRLDQGLDDGTAAAAVEREAAAERETRFDDRTTRLEAAARMAGRRLDEIDGFRAELATILDRIGASMEVSLTGIAQLGDQVKALEAIEAGRSDDRAAVQQRLDDLHDELLQLARSAVALEERVDESGERLTLAFHRIEPLGPAVITVERLDLATAQLGDRLTAAELLLNQRDDLQSLLDRAEEVERMVAELNPDQFVTREALDELRSEVVRTPDFDHSA
jgi:chromosome segregation ATPase